MSIEMDFEKLLKERRPNLSASSIKTYTSTLRSILRNVFPNEKTPTIDLFDNVNTILLHYENDSPKSFNSKLSALFVLTSNPVYGEELSKNLAKIKKETQKQVKTEKQKECTLEQEDLKTLWEKMKKYTDMIYKKQVITDTDLQTIQMFIVMSLMGGVFIPPRRAMDYCLFKIKDPTDDFNYLSKNKLVFNKYKTAKTYGRQEVVIPKELKSILTKWIKHNPTEWLLFDTKKQPLTAVKLNQRFVKLFGKKCSVNSLRHSYLTDKYAEHIPMRKEMAEDFEKMGSNINQETTYIQMDDVD
ncbi:MAG: hypothetical protein EBU08_11825 [Micrococcales bacterium]|nr:hypothetical protein [Micrococcales bacterium]